MGLFGLFGNKKKAESEEAKRELLELQKLVLVDSPDTLIMSEKELKAIAIKQAQRDIEIGQDCIRIVCNTKDPDTFFSRYDLLIESSDHMRLFEKHLNFSASPSLGYSEVWANQQKAIHEFLIRYFSDVFDQAAKLKTIKGKLNKYQKFYDSLQPYYDKMDAENIDYVETKYRAYTRSLEKEKQA